MLLYVQDVYHVTNETPQRAATCAKDPSDGLESQNWWFGSMFRPFPLGGGCLVPSRLFLGGVFKTSWWFEHFF